MKEIPEQQPSRVPFWRSAQGKKAIFGIVFLLALIILPLKFFFSTTQEDGQPNDAAVDIELARGYLPKSAQSEASLVFGGALNKVQDFTQVERNVEYWSVVRDLKHASNQVYANAPFLLQRLDYAEVLKNPQAIRFAAQPVRVNGRVGDAYALQVEANSLEVRDVYHIWLHDSNDNILLVEMAEPPPISLEELRKRIVEASGIFYQIYRYESQTPLNAIFGKALIELKRANYADALAAFQSVLAQDPNPIALSNWFILAKGEQFGVTQEDWQVFQAQGPEYANLLERLYTIADKAQTTAFVPNAPEQFYKRDVPLFLGKNLHLIDSLPAATPLSEYMSTPVGIGLGIFTALFLAGGFVLLFLRLQRSAEKNARKRREDFWREVRKSVKGVGPPHVGADDPKRLRRKNNPRDPGFGGG